MGVDGFPNALDAATVMHSSHRLVEQDVAMGGEDVQAENLAIGLIRNRFEPAAAITNC